ncbi:MAG: transglycosylase domain-containing protein [Candidatus Promineifilaceae bacterium]|nr:transglycosylase domain-containing protein [Candidatus Promineifilaceae bacterium]
MSNLLGPPESNHDSPHPFLPLRQPTPEEDKGHGLLKGCARIALWAGQLAIIVAILGLIAAAAGYAYLSNELADSMTAVVAYQGRGPGGTPRFFDRHGTLLFELEPAEKQRYLDYAEIPELVKQATIAVEDDTFWSNPGFDPEAILAAFVSNYRTQPERPVGASTITQQLVRHVAFTYEERITPSYERKLREVFLAFILTRQRSKTDILELYLNEIYYGNLAYGIEAAAQTYFGHGAADLSLAQAAFLAALPQAPGELDPYSNREPVTERQHFVLDLMVAENMITAEEAESAKAAVIRLQPRIARDGSQRPELLEAPHFVLYVQRELERRYGPDALTRGGWQITTSLDLNLQHFAESAARQWVAARAAAHDVNNAAVVVLKPGTGEILSMVGSLDYFDDSIDGQVNVALSPRQPGSAIKPITYAAAMERGWNAGDVLWDVPIELDLGDGRRMRPTNYDRRFHGPLLLRDALANSYNIPPIQLIRDIGVPAFISTGRKLGVESLTEPPGYYGLALTLGGGEVPLLELTHAYATLANLGRRPRLTGVLQIRDGRDRLVYDQTQQRLPAANALDPRIAYILTDILDDDEARIPGMGRNNPLDLPFPAAAKTGTTNDFRDNWTVGYTPAVAVGVWLGNTDGHPMRNSSGLRGAAPLWREIMLHIDDDPQIRSGLTVRGIMPPSAFTMPPGIDEREVCLPRGTGGATCTAKRTDLFLSSTPVHGVQRLGYVPDTISNPGAWTLVVAALSPAEAQRIRQPELSDGTSAPTQHLCVINYARRPAGANVRLMLAVPPYFEDEIRARRWAAANGFSMAPSIVCPGATARQAVGSAAGEADAAGESAAAPANAEWRIDSPRPGAELSGLVSVIGTANFDPAAVQYYKLEIGQGTAPTDWTTFGSTHSEPVINGQLETLHAGGLAPGDYVIRLILVRNDGNYPRPYAVPIRIGP